MREKRHENEHKVYIKVEAVFHPDGRLLPVALWWENGRRYTIDHVTDICRAASLKAGGSGIRSPAWCTAGKLTCFTRKTAGSWNVRLNLNSCSPLNYFNQNFSLPGTVKFAEEYRLPGTKR